jgi:hypothetical protein
MHSLETIVEINALAWQGKSIKGIARDLVASRLHRVGKGRITHAITKCSNRLDTLHVRQLPSSGSVPSSVLSRDAAQSLRSSAP